MPSTYAHYRFGTMLLPHMPGDVKRTIQRFRRLYDVGLHGPDLFYFHNPILKTGAALLGLKFHEQTGREFFQRVCRAARLERSEAAQAYIYGVLCHYCLDSAFHVYVQDRVHDGIASAREVEAEFDRYLLEQDGKIPPCAQDLSPHLKLTPGEHETVARFYPPASPRYVKECLQNMAFFVHTMAVPDGPKRAALAKGMSLFGREIQDMVTPAIPNPKCTHLHLGLMECYRQAEEKFPEMLQQLQAHLTYNASLEEDFSSIFG